MVPRGFLLSRPMTDCCLLLMPNGLLNKLISILIGRQLISVDPCGPIHNDQP